MSAAALEHVNITVSDTQAMADMLCKLFGWHIRWQGEATLGGHTIHVGTDSGYLAVYTKGRAVESNVSRYELRGGLNHVGVVVDDLASTEKRVHAAGFETHSHADYEPGRRFYFNGPDGIEFEVVSYA